MREGKKIPLNLRQYFGNIRKKRVSEISYGDEFAVFSWRFVSYMTRHAVGLRGLVIERALAAEPTGRAKRAARKA